jgi:hypothetical protein
VPVALCKRGEGEGRHNLKKNQSMVPLTKEGEDGGISVESPRGRRTPVHGTGQTVAVEDEEASDCRGAHVGKWEREGESGF